jgi:hypothetical protein
MSQNCIKVKYDRPEVKASQGWGNTLDIHVTDGHHGEDLRP